MGYMTLLLNNLNQRMNNLRTLGIFIIRLVFISVVLFHIGLKAEPASNAEGYWKSIDNKTLKPTAYWHLFIRDNVLYGYLVTYPDMKPDDICENCPGEFKDKPQLGTPWLKLQKRTDENKWEDGYIIDSGKGKKYRAKVWAEDGKLKVRGYVSIFYETQEWLKATKDEAERGFN